MNVWHKAITWIYDDQNIWRHVSPLSHYELKRYRFSMCVDFDYLNPFTPMDQL